MQDPVVFFEDCFLGHTIISVEVLIITVVEDQILNSEIALTRGFLCFGDF